MLLSDHFSLNSAENYLLKFLASNEDKYYAAAMTQIARDLSLIEMTDDFIDSIYVYTTMGDFFDGTMAKKNNFDFTKTQIYEQLLNRKEEGYYWGQVGKNEILMFVSL